MFVYRLQCTICTNSFLTGLWIKSSDKNCNVMEILCIDRKTWGIYEFDESAIIII